MTRPTSRGFERPLKVLIVDGSEPEREALRRLLGADGMKTFELPSAIGASREALQHGVDAAVIDVNASDQSGGRLAGLLRKNQRLSHLLIIAVSAQPADELLELRATVDAIISKDRVAGDLTSTLRRLHGEALAARPAECGSDA